ncbi:MAG: histidine phosphatase family protein [Gammaproteobacteria bacterium]
MDPRRRRRRQRRAGAVAAFMVLALGIAFFFEAQSTTTVIIVRHADVMSDAGDDVGLSPLGAIRAEELSRVLGDIDVVDGLDAILVGDDRASRETAAPLARRLNLPIQQVDTSSLTRIAKGIMKDRKGQIVLVVAKAAEIPILIPRFQGSKKVPDLADREYDNLYIVSVPWYGKVKTLRLRYGARPAPAIPAPGTD